MVKIFAAAAKEDRAHFSVARKTSKRKLIAVMNDSTTSRAAFSYTNLVSSSITNPASGVWTMHETVMDCSPNATDIAHTAQNSMRQLKRKLHDFLSDTLQDEVPDDDLDFEMGDHVSSGVFDMGSNTPRAGLQALGIDGLPCTAHRLSTLLGHMNDLPEWGQALEPLKKCVETVRKSAHNTHLCESLQVGPGKKKRCVNGPGTRWTHEPEVVARAEVLLPTFLLMNPQKMYFKDAAKRNDWKHR